MTGFGEIAAAGPVLAALGVCVLAGLVSFASPCVVPLVPGYLSYLAAIVGVEEERACHAETHVWAKKHEGTRRNVDLDEGRGFASPGGVLFVAGFTAVFVLGTVAVLGMTGALITNQLLLQRIGGVVTILMGLVFVGFIPRCNGTPVRPSSCRRSRARRCSVRCSRWAGRRASGRR